MTIGLLREWEKYGRKPEGSMGYWGADAFDSEDVVDATVRHEPHKVDDGSTLATRLAEVLLALHSLSHMSPGTSSGVGRAGAGVASDSASASASASASDGRLRLEHSGLDESQKEDATVDPHLAGLFLTIMTLALAVSVCAFAKRCRNALSTAKSEGALVRRIRRPAAAAVGKRTPEMFLCPISCEIMEDPVVTAAGESQCLARCDSACLMSMGTVATRMIDHGPRACACVLAIRQHIRSSSYRTLASHAQK
jgi:hypothetical protein